MVLSQPEIISLALSPVDDWINIAREDSKKLQMHYFGVGVAEYLTQIDGLENDDQIKLRKKHAISNRFLTDSLLRPLDNVWSAKGGSIKINIPDSSIDSFKDILSDVKGGLSIKNYLKNIWKDSFITDPNGLTFVEVNPVNEKAYITQKSIYSIKNMHISGKTPDYVVFEPHLIEESDKTTVKKLWIVDDAFYTLVIIKDEDKAEIAEQRPNTFGKVPAIINSLITDNFRKIRVSPIHNQIELFDKYLKNNSVKEIYQFLHGYPIFWAYVPPCKKCNGTGFIEGGTCPECDGTGKSKRKDISDMIGLNAPSEQGQPVIAPDVAGYVQPDLETWREQRTELDWLWNIIYFSQWGTTIEKGENETATGRFIDSQPVNNKLNDYADIIEVVHSELINLFGYHYFKLTYKECSVNYGRRYLIETADQVWEKYQNAKEKKAPVSSLDQLLEQYYESEYQRNEIMQAYYLKLIKIEPFVHQTVEEVQALTIPIEDKLCKIYFSDWIKSKQLAEIIDRPIEALRTELKTYINNKKTISNGTEQ